MVQVLKRALLAALLVCCFLLTGCSYGHELKDLELLTAVGIDKNEEGYTVCVQALKADQATMESYGESYRYLWGEGSSFRRALAEIYAQGAGELSFSQNRLYLLTYGALADLPELAAAFASGEEDIRSRSYLVALKNDLGYFMTAADSYGFDCCYKLLQVLESTEGAPRIDDLKLMLAERGSVLSLPAAGLEEDKVQLTRWLVLEQEDYKSYRQQKQNYNK